MADALTAAELERCAYLRSMCACDRLRSVARTMTQVYERAMGPGEPRVTQLPILVALGSSGPLALTGLAEALRLDRTTLTRNLGVLERDGLVATGADPHDARVRIATLTAEGVAALREGLERWGGAQRGVEERFGVERLAALQAELAALAAAVEV